MAGWDGPYDVPTTFHEPMVLYGYLAAKQAAEVDLLTAGSSTRTSWRRR